MKRIPLFLAAILAFTVSACGGSTSTPLPDPGIDLAPDLPGDLPAADTAPDATPDEPPDDASAPPDASDPAPDVEPDPAPDAAPDESPEGVLDPDAAVPDPDAAPEVPADAVVPPTDATDPGPGPDGTDPGPETFAPRAAWVFLDNPDENGGQPTQVGLQHLTDPAGYLTGLYADVMNCMPEPGGKRIWLSETTWADFCRPRRTVLPGDDGTYLHVLPPADLAAAGDPFAEVQMYHHMNRIHDYFKDVHGLSDGDKPVDALVNVEADYMGEGFQPFDNAMYLPPGVLDQLGLHIGLHGDVLVFGQGKTIDYSYEADVVEHEYSHFMVGALRLAAYTADEWGFDPSPLAMNEGSADYFPASRANDPVLGGWALKDAARDLSIPRKCPDDLAGEAHADGLIWSSALWEIRSTLGAGKADLLAWASIDKAGPTTTFEDMAVYVLEATDENLPGDHDVVAAILAAHGLDRCDRLAPWQDGQRLLYLEGVQSSGVQSLKSFVPASIQQRIEVPPGTTSLVFDVRAKLVGLTALMAPDLPIRLGLSARMGPDPIRYEFFPILLSNSQVEAEGEDLGDGRWRFTLSGSCLAAGGTVFVQFLNRSDTAVGLTERQLSFLTTPGDGPTNFDCATP